MKIPTRQEFEQLISQSDGKALQSILKEPWFNVLAPGAIEMLGCGQGENNHLEGDVAVHTGFVFDNTRAVSLARLKKEATFIQLLAAVFHDFKKPATRQVLEDGTVTFPGHEDLAAREIPAIAKRIELSSKEAEELHYLVAFHGEAHFWPKLSEELKKDLKSSPWITGLAVIQEADARSCILPGGSHLPVYWESIVE